MELDKLIARVLKKATGRDEEEAAIAENARKFQETQGMQDAPEEAPAEEGDLSDYTMPVKGLGRKAIAMMAGRSAPKLEQKLVTSAEDIAAKIKPNSNPSVGPTLDYSKINKPTHLGSGMAEKASKRGLDLQVEAPDIKDAKLMESLANMRDKEAAGIYAKGTLKSYLERLKKKRPDMFSPEE